MYHTAKSVGGAPSFLHAKYPTRYDMLSAMARGSYKHTKFDFIIIDDKKHGWRVKLTINGITYESKNAYASEMLAREAVLGEARMVINKLETEGPSSIPG